MRLAFSAFMGLHALLHLLGFFKSWKLLPLPELSGKTLVSLSPAGLRLMGCAWLLAAVVLAFAALLRGLRLEPWWMAGAAGVLLSQALIVLQWSDAKAGTLANLVIAFVIALTLADTRMRERLDRRMDLLLSDASGQHD